jgi:hypothetical protein
MYKKTLSMFGALAKKGFKNKALLSYSNKNYYKNNKLYIRNYLKLNSIIFNNEFKNKIKIKKDKILKKKKIKNKRLLKKLKTFKFISGRGQKKSKVFSRFKRTVISKLHRRYKLKKQSIYYKGKGIFRPLSYHKNKIKKERELD